MNKEIVKKGYEEAQKELQETQIGKIKDIVKVTLQKIQDVDVEIDEKKAEIKELEEEKRILKLDIDDLKEGRLDRIEERQVTDKRAKKVSVIVVEKIKEVHHHHYDRWYEPYKITYIPLPSYPVVNPIWYSTTGNNHNAFGLALQHDGSQHAIDYSNSTIPTIDAVFTVNSSIAKNNVIGTYAVGNKTIHLR